MSRLLKITDNGNGILVQGTDNILYPDNATLTFPYNSIILVTDESDIATFRSASNNDVLFSGLIGNIEIGSTTVTKANIIEKFDEIANQESGGGEPFDPTNYYTKSQTNNLLDAKADTSDLPTDVSELNNDAGYITNSALNGYATEQWVQNQGYLTEHQSLANYYTKSETDALIPNVEDYFDGAEYDSNTRRINFKHGNTVKAYIDANAFIKDGMVENVEISNGNLVITFNTDAGKQPITIPLTDIFNPSNYYDKTATDTLLQAKANTADLATVATSGDYNDLSNKPTIPSLTGYATETWVGQQGYAESSDLATVATTGSYDDLTDKPTIPTVPTNVSAFTNDAGYLDSSDLAGYATQSDLADYQPLLTAGTNITITNNVISASGSVQVQADWNETDTSDPSYIQNKPTLATVATSGDYDDLSNKPTIPTVPTNVSDFTNDAGYLTSSDLAGYATEAWVGQQGYAESSDLATVATTGSYNDLSNKPTIPDVSNYYTKTESDNKYLTKAVFDVKEETISAALNDLDSTKQDVLTAGANITISNNVISATGGTQVQADWNQSDSSAVDYIKNKPVIPDTSDFVTITQYNNKELAIAEALTDLNENKADKSDVPNMSNYYTKTQTDTAISTAVGQIDLSGYMTTSAFDVKEEVISSALNDLDGRIGDIQTILESI